MNSLYPSKFLRCFVWGLGDAHPHIHFQFLPGRNFDSDSKFNLFISSYVNVHWKSKVCMLALVHVGWLQNNNTTLFYNLFFMKINLATISSCDSQKAGCLINHPTQPHLLSRCIGSCCFFKSLDIYKCLSKLKKNI